VPNDKFSSSFIPAALFIGFAVFRMLAWRRLQARRQLSASPAADRYTRLYMGSMAIMAVGLVTMIGVRAGAPAWLRTPALVLLVCGFVAATWFIVALTRENLRRR
jgi:hypothetical protein